MQTRWADSLRNTATKTDTRKTGNLGCFMSAKEIEFEMKNHSKKKASAPAASLGNSVKHSWRTEQQSHADPRRWWRRDTS